PLLPAIAVSPQRNLVTKLLGGYWRPHPSGQLQLRVASACQSIRKPPGQVLRIWCGRGRVEIAVQGCRALSFCWVAPGIELRRYLPCAGRRESGPVGCKRIRDNSNCDSPDKRRIRQLVLRRPRTPPILANLSRRTHPNNRAA